MSSHLKARIIPSKSPRKLKIGVDELALFQTADKIYDVDSILKTSSLRNLIIACNFSIHNLMQKLVFL